ncbi:M48 family metalloprotease [Amycolatopsis sp. H6(2020)]|nr:M48 family metalloprotease [Amycolatopsis sp. H6(2020)]
MREKLRGAFSRPPGYRNGFIWFVTGMLRDKRGLAGALAAAWFNLPLAIFGGGAGLVVGAIIGYVGGVGLGGRATSWAADVPVFGTLVDSALMQSGGILGLIAGAVIGLIAGFATGLLLPWIGLASADPALTAGLFLGQLVVAFLVGVLYTVFQVAAEGWVFRVAGYRQPSRRERELILPVLEDCARRLGLAKVPPLLMDDDRLPNAYAGTRHIIVTRGFLDEFNYDKEPLAGVLCHELTHWRNADPLSGIFVRGVALPLYIAFNVFTWLMDYSRNGVVRVALLAASWPLMVCIRFFLVPLQAAGSRAAEYRADQGAVAAGHRQGIRRVLARFRDSFDGARNGWEAAICASHPPNELRLEAVEEPGAEYPLPDADGPAIPMPVVVTGSVARD